MYFIQCVPIYVIYGRNFIVQVYLLFVIFTRVISQCLTIVIDEKGSIIDDTISGIDEMIRRKLIYELYLTV